VNIVGGKAGGKNPTALGQGTNYSKVDEAMEHVTDYLEKLQI
jgi:alanyl-tRNA synthetase